MTSYNGFTEARKKANEKYLNSLDEIKVRVPKGKKQIIKEAALINNETMNEFIVKAIDNRINQD